jgi:steroid 5-alpha reductase family enzyme
MTTLPSLALVGALAVIAQTAGWFWQQRNRNAGIVDAIWAGGVGAAAIVLAVTGSGALWPRATLGVLGGLWGLRLAAHLWRRVRSEHEDGRYAYLRARWGNHGLRWLAFFEFQALLIVLFALPFAAVAANPLDGPRIAWASAIVIWLIAVSGEALADAQLRRFRANPANRGRTCRDGLWRYSRHPNYFFEWLHWFTYVLLAIGSPLASLAWSGPIVMYVFLRWLSGIPFTEMQALRTRGEDYRDYQRTTSMLFPWFPRSDR